jgi:K(+)-stimulated pyrophosphate-energized sodium pump
MIDFVVMTDWAWLLGVVGLVAAAGIYGYVKKQPAGTEVMIDLGEQSHDGAMAFLRREYTVLSVFVVVVAILLGLAIGRLTSIAYLVGALTSVAAGFFGM